MTKRAVTKTLGSLAAVDDVPNDVRPKATRRKRGAPTATANFGSSRRESHDASAFYDRFSAPELSTDDTIRINRKLDVVYTADARAMKHVESDSVALVVTSPPYFAGKQYEEALGEGGIPATYFEYLELLRDVFAECKRVLEPGGRIAVNVANLGRRPYRSLAGDVVQIIEGLGLLMRGEVVWWKGRAAGSSCAWGTFQRPNNPVLRDVTERIVIASKGRFDRAKSAQQRYHEGFPSTATITRDEFLEATTDLWEIPPESATRVGHPAPFPVELPKRLIELYTYKSDVVLDPFMGSGTTAVASIRTGRHFIGFDTDPDYVSTAKTRIKEEKAKLSARRKSVLPAVEIPAVAVEQEAGQGDFQARAVREGRKAKELALSLLENCGFSDVRSDVRIPSIGMDINFLAQDKTGQGWAFEVSGAFTSTRAGLRRADTLWKALGRASVFASAFDDPLVLLTTDAPPKGSPGYLALQRLIEAGVVFDLVEILDPEDQVRLKSYGEFGHPDR